MEVLITTIISEILTLLGVIATCWISHSKTLYRIEQLEKKQDKYNNLIARTFECEKDIELLQQEVHLHHQSE